VQTAAFEIEGDVIRALYVVRNPDKLRHLARAALLRPGRATTTIPSSGDPVW
jgi:hypothetical protein